MNTIKYHARIHAASLIVCTAMFVLNGWIGIVVLVVAIGVGAYLNPHTKS
ncbi:MAG: hypothetical protein Q8R25_04550 [bacterium]|nr:hypothetical protein [bacterium]